MTKRMHVGMFILAATAAIAVTAPAHAIDKCKVKVDGKTGVIGVSATGVSGPLQWGSTAGAENQAFFNPSCVDGATAKACRLADPSTLASKTPPSGCTIYLDDGTAPCSVWIRGCSPGQRDAPPKGSLVWKDVNGVTAGASVDDASALIRDDGTVLARISYVGESVFSDQGALHFNASDCSGPALVFGAFGGIRPVVVVNNPTSPVYYAPDSGTIQTDGSILVAAPFVNSPIDCGMLGGGTFIAPHGCCQFVGGTSPLTTPAVLDVSGLTLPLHPALQ